MVTSACLLGTLEVGDLWDLAPDKCSPTFGRAVLLGSVSSLGSELSPGKVTRISKKTISLLLCSSQCIRRQETFPVSFPVCQAQC